MSKNRTLGTLTTILAALLAALAFGAAPAVAAKGGGGGSGGGTGGSSTQNSWVVSLGDSYISGEAGRWAGNTNNGESIHDAGGPTTYYDNAGQTAELIERCHRSHAAEIHIFGGSNSLNLACSGATTATHTDGSYFKPGIDFYDDGNGHQGQALMLQNFAAGHPVSMVAVSIGGNDFGFADIVQQCVTDFLGSPSWWPDYCYDDSVVTNAVSPSNVSAQQSKIATAYQNIRQAMRNAGYADDSWTLLVQNYPSPIPHASGFRYSQSGYTRQSTGGCGFWNADANYANDTLLPTINGAVFGAIAQSGLTNVRTLDLSAAFNGRRLCENTVGLYEEVNVANWTRKGAIDKTEWINTIRTVTATGDYYIQESLHPNYWGQLALRSCVRQAYNGGSPVSGSCTIAGTGTTQVGEPKMTLQ